MANPRKYTKEFIVQALLILQRNDFNVNKTAKELRLQQVTLRNWKIKYGPDVFSELSSDDKLINPTERKKLISTLKEDILSNEKIFLDKVLAIRDMAIDRAEQLLPQERDLNKIANILRIMQELLTGEHIKSLDERNQHISFFNNIVNKQFITNNNLIQHEADTEQRNITQGD